MRTVTTSVFSTRIIWGTCAPSPPEPLKTQSPKGMRFRSLPSIRHHVTSRASKAFSEPRDLFLHEWTVPLVEMGAVVGAILIVLGTLLYVISYRTRDWVSIRIGGAGDPGMLITSASVVDAGVPVETDDTRLIITDLGAVIITIREGRTADLINSMRGDE